MKTRDNKRTVKFDLFYFFKITFLGRVLKQPTHSLLGAWSFLLVHIWFTPSEEPKGFVNCFFKIWNHGTWTMKSDHEKRPSSMVQLHGPWCKPALRKTNNF